MWRGKSSVLDFFDGGRQKPQCSRSKCGRVPHGSGPVGGARKGAGVPDRSARCARAAGLQS